MKQVGVNILEGGLLEIAEHESHAFERLVHHERRETVAARRGVIIQFELQFQGGTAGQAGSP
ncbi:MAG: hypothetical protein P8090_14175 [Gammaproteobacteria bacterium]